MRTDADRRRAVRPVMRSTIGGSVAGEAGQRRADGSAATTGRGRYRPGTLVTPRITEKLHASRHRSADPFLTNALRHRAAGCIPGAALVANGRVPEESPDVRPNPELLARAAPP